MEELGVKVGLAKSLVAKRLVLEFAKRFFIPQDASPISLSEVVAATSSVSALLEYAKKYELSLPQILTLLGYGYKVKGNLHAPFNKSSGRLVTLYISYLRYIKELNFSELISKRSLVSD